MWWIEDRSRGSNSSSRRRLKTRNLGASTRHATTTDDRSGPVRPFGASDGPARSNPAAFRSLRLSAEQHAANLELTGVTTDLESPKSSEVKRLEADIRALERVIHEGRAERQQQEAELMRLRSECERWLSETQVLSAHLTAEVERRTETAQQVQLMPSESQFSRDSQPKAA